MASSERGKVAILPIQPRYAEAIITGVKKVEFRRRNLRNTLNHIVIYASSPVRKIVGFFRVTHVTVGSPAEIWKQFRKVGGIEKAAFEAYYKGAKDAVAIGIGDVVVLRKPLALKTLCESLSPPQSFVYLRMELFEKVRSHGI